MGGMELDGRALQLRLWAARRASLDTPVTGHHERAFCMHSEVLDDWLITDYHVTMIGYGKKNEFHIPNYHHLPNNGTAADFL